MGVMASIAMFSIPMYRNYIINNDLNLAEQQTIQMLNSAQARSRAGFENSTWGVSITKQTIYKGPSYAERDPSFDEIHSFPPTISVSNLIETTYSRLDGIPDRTGTIVLKASNGDTREINVSDQSLLAGPTAIEENTNVRIKIVFERIKNYWSGSAQATAHVGPDGTEYQESEWISLQNGETIFIDEGIMLDAPGLAIERKENYVRILAYGDISWFSREIVDARIIFEGATVDHIENDSSSNLASEDPFDGYVSDWIWGDEATTAPDLRSVLFQTRCSVDSDAILIYWQQTALK